MNRPDRRRVELAKQHRDALAELAKKLDNRTIEDLARRATYSPNVDGHKAASGSEVRTPGISNPTLAAIERLAGGRPEIPESEPGAGDAKAGTPDTWTQNEADPVGDALRKFFGLLSEMGGIAKEAHDTAQYILAAADAVSVRRWNPDEVGFRCDVCNAVVAGTDRDRLRGVGGGKGCEPCYRDWLQAGRPMAGPEYNRWAEERHAFVESKGAAEGAA